MGRDVSCYICGKSFSERESLRRHLQGHVTGKHWACDICGSSYSLKLALEMHQRIHKNNDFIHTCKTCGKWFRWESSLILHNRVHSGGKPYICNVCGKGFWKNGYLQGHLSRVHSAENSHTDTKPVPENEPYTCEVCSKSFLYRDAKLNHICIGDANVHDSKSSGEGTSSTACNSNSNTSFKCVVCMKAFPDAYAFKRHILCHSRTDNRDHQYVCQVCGKPFDSNVSLKIHLISHAAEKPHVCSICGESFKFKKHLKEHRATCIPQKEKPSIKFLTFNYAIVNKIKQNLQEKKVPEDYSQMQDNDAGKVLCSFKCQVCEEVFASYDALVDHICIRMDPELPETMGNDCWVRVKTELEESKNSEEFFEENSTSETKSCGSV